MNQRAITVYSALWCPYCQRAKALLTEKRLAFTEIDVEADLKFREEMVQRSSRRTVPQIFIGDSHIGGYDELVAIDRSGELDRLLQGD